MNPIAEFEHEIAENIAELRNDVALQHEPTEWVCRLLAHHYSYNFNALGRPIIQYPHDMVAV